MIESFPGQSGVRRGPAQAVGRSPSVNEPVARRSDEIDCMYHNRSIQVAVREFLGHERFDDGRRHGRRPWRARAGETRPADRIHQDITRQTQVTQEVVVVPPLPIFRLATGNRQVADDPLDAENRRGSSSGP